MALRRHVGNDATAWAGTEEPVGGQPRAGISIALGTGYTGVATGVGTKSGTGPSGVDASLKPAFTPRSPTTVETNNPATMKRREIGIRWLPVQGSANKVKNL